LHGSTGKLSAEQRALLDFHTRADAPCASLQPALSSPVIFFQGPPDPTAAGINRTSTWLRLTGGRDVRLRLAQWTRAVSRPGFWPAIRSPRWGECGGRIDGDYVRASLQTRTTRRSLSGLGTRRRDVRLGPAFLRHCPPRPAAPPRAFEHIERIPAARHARSPSCEPNFSNPRTTPLEHTKPNPLDKPMSSNFSDEDATVALSLARRRRRPVGSRQRPHPASVALRARNYRVTIFRIGAPQGRAQFAYEGVKKLAAEFTQHGMRHFLTGGGLRHDAGPPTKEHTPSIHRAPRRLGGHSTSSCPSSRA